MSSTVTAAGLAQPGILAFGTTNHAYIEFDLRPEADLDTLANVLGNLAGAITTGAGHMVVIGLRPELLGRIQPGACPDGVHGFNEPIVGPDGFTMPATQHDLIVWLAGGSRDVVFDGAKDAIAQLADHAVVAEEEAGWAYHGHRDLTGFVDGTENPALAEVPDVALFSDGPAAGASLLLVQKWAHESSWSELSDADQEAAIGRTKADDIELDPKPETSHAARTDQDEIGKIVRRNLGYGTASRHGTMFVGLTNDQAVMQRMLERMAGIEGPRDELTRHSHADTGSYYVLPPVAMLNSHCTLE
ncbi:MAG: Dyp-type peroxidase [Microthrixaceae bacterium]|nr:Dyp-type peroxidase [Microthrixaceae bacterium]MCO5311588.1 Dyp-type peroxidase [Microthrixaceae bacterium]